MLKKIGLPLIALTACLTFVTPRKADARVHFGIAIGGPVYTAPAYPYAYSYPYSPYGSGYYAQPAYPYGYGYGYDAPYYSGYGVYGYGYGGRHWEHERHEWHERHERYEHGYRGHHEHGREH